MKSKYLIAFSITAVLVIASLSIVTGFAVSNKFRIGEKINWKTTAPDMSKTRGPSSNQPPVAIAGQDKNAYVGANIIFDGSQSYDPDGTSLIYLWEFSDGSRSLMNPAQHAFAQEGTYSATLTVTDSLGATGTATISISVIERPGIMPNLPQPTVDPNYPSVKFYVLNKRSSNMNTFWLDGKSELKYYNKDSNEIGTITSKSITNNKVDLVWNGQEAYMESGDYLIQGNRILLFESMYDAMQTWHTGANRLGIYTDPSQFIKEFPVFSIKEYSTSGYLLLQIQQFSVGKKSTLNIKTDKGTIEVYLPEITLNNLAFYVASDGSTYHAYSYNGQLLSPEKAFNVNNLARAAPNANLRAPSGLYVNSVYEIYSNDEGREIWIYTVNNLNQFRVFISDKFIEVHLNEGDQINVHSDGCNLLRIMEINKDENDEYYAKMSIDNGIVGKIYKRYIFGYQLDVCAIYGKDIILPQRVIPTRTLPTDLNIENLKATDTPTNLKQSLAKRTNPQVLT